MSVHRPKTEQNAAVIRFTENRRQRVIEFMERNERRDGALPVAIQGRG